MKGKVLGADFTWWGMTGGTRPWDFRAEAPGVCDSGGRLHSPLPGRLSRGEGSLGVRSRRKGEATSFLLSVFSFLLTPSETRQCCRTWMRKGVSGGSFSVSLPSFPPHFSLLVAFGSLSIVSYPPSSLADAAIRVQIAAADVGKTRAAVISGWLTKTRRGHSKRRWCALLGRTLYFSRSERSPPIGSLKVRLDQ